MANLSALTKSERDQLAEILRRRANEIVLNKIALNKHDKLSCSVDMALSREIDRLRRLADKVAPPETE